MDTIHRTYEGAADTEANKAKGRIEALADATRRSPAELLRIVGRTEAERGAGEIGEMLVAIRDAIARWREGRGET